MNPPGEKATRRAARVLFAAGVLLTAHGCGIGYYAHLASGQCGILWNSRPVSEVMDAEETDAGVRAKLARVREVKRYGVEILGLEGEGVYESVFDTKGGPIAYNVSACPKDDLEPYTWCFPFVGRAPYKGFFDRERALAEATDLEAQGYDTLMRGVSAYSTLGWFKDPINTGMLAYDEADLAELVLHEMTHATVWVPGGVPFNESLATYVGEAGAFLWLESVYGVASPEVIQAEQRKADAGRFQAFMFQSIERFEALYAEPGLSRDEKLRLREALLEAEKARYRTIRHTFETDRYDGFERWTMNNAHLMSFKRYHSDQDLFARVHARAGTLRAAIDVFRQAAEAEDARRFLTAFGEGTP